RDGGRRLGHHGGRSPTEYADPGRGGTFNSGKGSAFVNYVCSASVMCADLGRLEEQLQTLERAGCEELHFDIMDGQFVPNITLGADFIAMAKRVCGLRCDAHLMIRKPENYIKRFVEAGA